MRRLARLTGSLRERREAMAVGHDQEELLNGRLAELLVGLSR